MNQTWIVLAIVIIAAVYVGRRFYRSATQENSCACGCSGCDIADDCTHPELQPEASKVPEKDHG